MKEVGKEFISIVDKDKALSRYLWRIIIVLSISIIALSYAFITVKNTTKVKVELPAKVMYKYAPVVIAGIDGSNAVYYKLWSRYIVNELANFTYENVEKKFMILKKMMRPTVLAEKEKEIDNFVSNIITNLISQKFTVEKIKIENKKSENDLINEADVVISGAAKQKVGKKSFERACNYKIKYKFIEGVIYVENFGTDCL